MVFTFRAREVETLRQEIQTMKNKMDRQPKPASLQELEAVSPLTVIYLVFVKDKFLEL